MAFSTSRTEALMRIKGTIKVQSIFSPFYNVSVLNTYSKLEEKNKSKLKKFQKEYKSKYEKELTNDEVKKSIDIIQKALKIEKEPNSYKKFTLKKLGLLDNSDSENDIFKIIKDDETLLVLPDYTESNDTFEDYIKKGELKESVKNKLNEKYDSLDDEKKKLINNQTFFFKVMTRNKKNTESMKTTVSAALEELDKYLQGRLNDESSRNGTNMNRTIKKIFFFTDNEGKWSLHHFNNDKYNESIVQILSDSFDAYSKESRTKKEPNSYKTFTLKQLGLLDYSDCENDIFKIIKDDETLLVLPDYTESNDTFEDYIKKGELKESVKKSLNKKYDSLDDEKKKLIKNQTFLLKVMTRNKKSTESMKTSVSEALEELDKYLQGRLYDEANRGSRNGVNMNRTIKKIFFFTDNEGNWSLHHFDAKKYNKSIVQILSDSFDAYMKESKTKKDDSIGIQVKQMERYGKAGVRIPSYFKMSFKEVFKEKGGDKTVRNYNLLEFEHFVLTEELKGIFDPAYIKSYSVDDADAKSVFEIMYKYNIESDKDPYFFKKIVINKNKTYILEINHIPSFIISGYFQGRSKNYKFKITRVESKDIVDRDLDFGLLFMIKYAFSYKNIIDNKLYDNHTLAHFFSQMIQAERVLDSYIIRGILKDVISDEIYKFLLPENLRPNSYEKIDENIGKIIDSLKKEQISIILQNIDENYTNDKEQILDELISKWVELYFSNLKLFKEVNEGVLLYDLLKLNLSLQMKVYKKKGDDIHNFKVLGKKNDRNSLIEYLQGVLKEYEPNTYYKIFSTNLIDTNLNPKRQINYYDDMKITEQNFQAFLLSKSPNSNREKTFNFEKELLLVLTDTSLLNDYYNFVSEEFPDDVLDEGSSYLSISEIEEFKYEVLKGIIDIIFHVGTSFYVSNVSSKNTTNKVTTRGFSSYEISNIDDIIIISQYNDPPFDDEGVVIDYFVDGKVKKEFNQRSNYTQPQSQSLVVRGGQSNIPVAQDEIIRESYIDPKFYSYERYKETINAMKSEYKSKDETRSLVVLHFDLLYHKDVDKKSNCASRKKRITKKVNELFSNFKAYMRNTTRYLKPKIKNSKGGGTKKIKK